MGQVLHGSATTTEAVRRALQRSEASVRALARHDSISPTTVQKWRKRKAVTNRPMGPTGSAAWLFDHFGLTAQGIAASGRRALARAAP